MALAPSTVTMPAAQPPYPSILTFLERRFPQVAIEIWQQRLAEGKVLDEAGQPITPQTPYAPQRRLFYFREQEREPLIPFAETILFQNDEILVADKPPFLPVIPSGPYVDQCLLARLQKKTGIKALAPVHRLDRETAGLVLFSTNKANRGLYHNLFRDGAISKTYVAICHYAGDGQQQEWLVENRIVEGSPWFRMQIVDGPINARTKVKLLAMIEENTATGDHNDPARNPAGGQQTGGRARFQLTPLTGKKHQLRLHLSSLGFGIINDRSYPELHPKAEDDWQNPLQLLAQSLRFRDPITGQPMEFQSERRL